MRDSLAAHQLYERITAEEFNALAAKAYHSKSLGIVPLDELSDPYVKQEIINFCDKKYGKKHNNL